MFSKNNFRKFSIFISMYLGIFLFYSTKKTFALISPLITDVMVSVETIGVIFMVQSFSFAISKIINGIISDRVKGYIFMPFGLAVTGVAHVLMSRYLASTNIIPLVFINSFSLSIGWSVCSKVLSLAFSSDDRGFFWSSLATSQYVSLFCTSLFFQYFIRCYSWQTAFFVIGISCIIGSAILFLFLYYNIKDLSPDKNEKKNPGFVAMLSDIYDNILKNGDIWLLASASICLYIIRSSMDNWLPIYFTAIKHYSSSTMLQCIGLYEVGCALGCIFIGKLSDIFFDSNRSLAMLVFTIGYIVMLFVMYLLQPLAIPLVDYFMVCIIAAFIAGPQMLFGLVCVERCSKRLSATVNGFIGTCSYCFSALATRWLVPYVVSGQVFLVLTAVAFVGLGFLVVVATRPVPESELR